MIKVESFDFSKELSALIGDELKEKYEEYAGIIDEMADDLVTEIKANSPVKTGAYRKGWIKEGSHGDWVIKNKTRYKLIHLLENGHLARDGSFVQPKPHVFPAFERIKAKYSQKLK